jgi:FkbM family methyltransferase
MSYSQSGEDTHMIGKYLSALPNSMRKYIELGALDGVHASNTKLLEDNYGWSGVLIEPNPFSFERLRINRPNNILFNNVISNIDSPLTFEYYQRVNLAGVSSIKQNRPHRLNQKWFVSSDDDPWMRDKISSELKSIEVSPLSLSSVVLDSGIKYFGFMSLDVEGHEYNVLQSYDWSVPILFILVENNGDKRVDDILRLHGYRFVESVAHNSLYTIDS